MLSKIVVTTTYQPVTDEWIEWYISELKGKVPIDFDLLKTGIPVSFTSKDPSSETSATTTYQLITLQNRA
jgi:hypothetical protein